MRFNHRLLSYEQDGGVTCRVEGPIAVEHIRCDCLISADGTSSTVRKLAGVGFNGFTYPERFLTLSTAYRVEAHDEGLGTSVTCRMKGWCVLLCVPGL